MSRSLTPQNPLTTNTISVSSTGGFSAGDLVYQKSGDVGLVSGSAVSTATFNVTSTVIPGGLAPSTAQHISVNSGYGGGEAQGFPCAAKLTNGNMVVVYVGISASQNYFRIIDENGTQVVAETFISTNGSTGAAQICVAALTGGGFAVAYCNASVQLGYAIYSNTGSVVTSATTDSTINITNSAYITISSRPDGSFIVVVNNYNASQTQYKVYSATGTQVIAWTNVAAYYQIYCQISVAVRSDNSFVISTWTTSTNIQYYVYSAVGGATTNGSASTPHTPDSSYVRLSSTALTNDTVVFYFCNAGPNCIIELLSSSNVLTNIGSVGSSTAGNVKALSSGGFIIMFPDQNYQYTQYSVRNASGTQTASGIYYGVGACQGVRGNNYSIVEMASNIAAVGSFGYGSGTGQTNCMSMFQIVTATNLVRNFTTASMNTAAISSSVSGYARANSTPNAAAFLAATSTTLTKSVSTLTSSISTYVLAPVVVTNTAASYVFNRVMQNGQIVVLYNENSSTAIKFAVYSPAGVYIATYTVAASSVGSTITKCCVLTNGNLLISYFSSSSVITFAIYSPSFVLQSTTTQADVSSNSGLGYDISAMTNSRFVLGYYSNGTGIPSWIVYDSAATQLASNSFTSTYNYGIAVAGTAGGGFVSCNWNSTGSNRVHWFVNPSGNSFTNPTNQDYSGSGSVQANGATISITPSGQVFTQNSNGSYNLPYMVEYGIATDAKIIFSNNTGSANAYGCVASTVMADGSIVAIRLDSSSGYYWGRVSPVYNGYNGGYTALQSSQISMNSLNPYTYNNNPCACVSALYDNQFVFTYRANSTLYPVIAIGCTSSGSYSTTTVAGTTASNVAYYPSQSNGYVFKGVTATAATAGGSGVVQNVGSAQLNSQYPAGTTYQAFDSTGTLIQGTKGTITGRNVNMTGTS